MAGRWALIFTVLSLFTLANPASAADAPICAAAAPPEGLAQFFVTKSNDGYVLLLPPGLLKKLPPETDYKVSLTATNDTSAIITGHPPFKKKKGRLEGAPLRWNFLWGSYE